MALSISDLTPEGRRYFEQLQKLSRLEVQVGFQEGQTYEDGKALKDLGVFCKGLVQQEIVDGGFVANKPSTIKKKKSEQPLIDTGHMRQSVDFVIKERGD